MSLELAEKVLKFVSAQGLDADIRTEVMDPISIQVSNGLLESLNLETQILGSVRIYERGYTGFFAFHTFSQKLEKTILQWVSLVKTLPKKASFREVYFSTLNQTIKTSFDIDPSSKTLEEKVALLTDYSKALKGKEDSIQNGLSIYQEKKRYQVFLNTRGAKVILDKTWVGIGLYAVAKEGALLQRQGFSDAGFNGFEKVLDKQAVIEECRRDTMSLLKVDSLPSGKYQVILDNSLSGVLAHEAFGHLAEADFTYENESMKEILTEGREFGVKELSIIDRGNMEGLAGYCPVDDEGFLATKTHLIAKGRFNSLMFDTLTASKMNHAPTGNGRALNAFYEPMVRMTNTYIDRGEAPVESLFDEVKDGIYCTSYLGGMTNLGSFTFTPMLSFEIKNGKKVRQVRDLLLKGNIFDTLHQITKIGNDLKHFGTLGGCGKNGQNGLPVTVGSPHVLLRDIEVVGS